MPHIDNLIQNISRDTLLQFLRTKISSFKPDDEDLDYLFPEDIFDKYESIEKIGEAVIDNDDLIVITSKTTDPLTERSGKKKQYEIAKKILKHEVKDAALFVFYDDDGNFRFSFVKANYLGTKRDFTDFKRYTYFVSTKQTNRTFIKQVGGCNFNSLDEIIEAFSVEPLNKLFYQEIAKAFYNLIGGKVKIGTRNVEYDTILKLPSTPTDGNRKVYQEFGVRLIGRTIFCWFLKNKKSKAGIPLVPESWLSSKTVIDTNNNQHDYYHTILEKLFFLVLNKKQDDRTPYDLPSEQEIIPFLNGGLFEPHIDDFFGENGKPNFALDIPNQWFKELFEVLEQYNFTIDENSIYDAEVSIDPEMLGTIFENLLAEIDPDTQNSARKATGSFYTPREIVDYMVEQSLFQYLKTKTAIDDDELLLELFKEGGENRFGTSDTKNILRSLSGVKILDPACGSGAFPMGALHKIITALHKLDPDASWWKAKQIENIPNVLAKKILKEKLDSSSADYIRKLGIIQNSIYGVDIQPIASEISKLRSFLSLVIDENINDEAENRGIEPLPNLEFKFVTANTLIGLEEKDITVLDFGQTEELQDQLKIIRNKYLQSYGKEKDSLKKEFEEVQAQIYKNEINGGGQNQRALQLASWNPFNHESNEWFDPYWMYGVEQFDIIIGNPPYIGHKGGQKNLFRKLKRTTLGKLFNNERMDIFYYFFHKSINVAFEGGIISFITTNYYLTADSAIKLRSDFKLRARPFKLINFNEFKIFESAVGQHNIITFLKKEINFTHCDIISVNRKGNAKNNILNDILNGKDNLSNYYTQSLDRLFDSDKKYIRIINSKSEHILSINNLLDKIKLDNQKLGSYCNISQGIVTGIDKVSPKHIKRESEFSSLANHGVFVISNDEKEDLGNSPLLKPWFKNSDIGKYYVNEENNKWLIHTSVHVDLIKFSNINSHLKQYKKLIRNRNYESGELSKAKKLNRWWALSSSRWEFNFDLPKIVSPQRSYSNVFGFTEKSWYASADVYFITNKNNSLNLKYILGILNSKLIYFWLYYRGKKKGEMLELYLTPLSEIPIKKSNNTEMSKIIALVEEIISLKTINESNDVNDIQSNIDVIIYKIYNLNYNEVLLIDPEFNLTQKEYENYSIN